MPKRSRKLPTDPDRLATISEITMGELRDVEMPSSKDDGKPPNDPIQAVHSVLAQLITGEEPHRLPPEPKKDPAAFELGRRGALKGGKKRMETMTQEQRKESARKAAEARWRRK